MSLVVDASVACKWFVEEEGSTAAESLLASDGTLIAPDLIVAEVCSAIWKKCRAGAMTSDQAAAVMDTLPGFFDDLVPCRQLGGRSLALAEALDHPVYDCFYLALAEREDTVAVTADARLLGRIAGTAWAARFVGLDGLPLDQE